jgi:hypothetical protein
VSPLPAVSQAPGRVPVLLVLDADTVALLVAYPGAVLATRTSFVSQSPCHATDRGSACLNFLGFCLLLGHPHAQIFSAWPQAPWLVCVPALPDPGALRCMFAGRGAVPTDNVTLASTKES